jgi:hypothetical protein
MARIPPMEKRQYAWQFFLKEEKGQKQVCLWLFVFIWLR